jgi:aminoglycoside phosphotransferase (APT) family kinase protein
VVEDGNALLRAGDHHVQFPAAGGRRSKPLELHGATLAAYDPPIPAEKDPSELTLIGTGLRAEVFEWDAGRVLKLARTPADAPLIERERRALEVANSEGAPAPRLYEQVEVAGRPGLILERLDGEDLLITLTKRPWRVLSVARAMGEVHAALNQTAAPSSLPPLREELRWRLSSDLVPEDVRGIARRRLDQLPDGDRICHGDLHPANLLPGGGGHVAIDWTNAARGDPSADVARTRIIILLGPLPPGASKLMTVGRELLLRRYVRAYARRNQLDRQAVRDWEPVWAAARLAEDISEEREGLLEMARA